MVCQRADPEQKCANLLNSKPLKNISRKIACQRRAGVETTENQRDLKH
jgi:hypothetical protein